MDGDLMIDVAGLRMFGRPGRGPYVVKDEGLEGWEDGVDMRSDNIPMPNQHGSYVLPRYQESRTLGVQGLVMADNVRELTNYRSRLAGLLAHGRPGRVQITSGGLTLWATAMLASKTKTTRRRGTYYADFTLNLWCPDPRKFGDTSEFTAKVGEPATVFHRGNYDAPPRFVVSGYAPGGYALVVNGRRFNVTQPVVTASPHTIDYDDGRLRIGGAVVHGGLGVTATPHIPPGRSISVEIVPLTTGTPTAKLTLLDTYI